MKQTDSTEQSLAATPAKTPFSTDERDALGQVSLLKNDLALCRRANTALEQRLTACPPGPRRRQLVHDLLEAKAEEDRVAAHLGEVIVKFGAVLRPIPHGSRS